MVIFLLVVLELVRSVVLSHSVTPSIYLTWNQSAVMYLSWWAVDMEYCVCSYLSFVGSVLLTHTVHFILPNFISQFLERQNLSDVTLNCIHGNSYSSEWMVCVCVCHWATVPEYRYHQRQISPHWKEYDRFHFFTKGVLFTLVYPVPPRIYWLNTAFVYKWLTNIRNLIPFRKGDHFNESGWRLGHFCPWSSIESSLRQMNLGVVNNIVEGEDKPLY